jgi:CubicO group peptidase (beta-lactamase class C family)
VIVERVAGKKLVDFLKERIFTPLHMTTVADVDAGPLGPGDAGAYLRNGVGPLRPAPKEGPGWLGSAGELGMTPHDLALWDMSVINRGLLKPSSYATQQTDVLLANGVSTGYGLGVSVGTRDGRRRISHGGAVSGYTTSNEIYPDDRTAIVVCTNIYPGAAGAPGQIAGRIADVLFASTDAAAEAARAKARRIYDGLVRGTIDRSLLTADANAYFSKDVLADYAASLRPLGAPTRFTQTGESLRGGMTIRSYRFTAGRFELALTTMTLPDGRIDQYIIERAG